MFLASPFVELTSECLVTFVWCDGPIQTHLGRPSNKILEPRGQTRDIRRGRMRLERLVTGERFHEREVRRCVCVLEQLVLQTPWLGARRLDQFEQDAADVVDGLWTGGVAGDHVNGKWHGDRVLDEARGSTLTATVIPNRLQRELESVVYWST